MKKENNKLTKITPVDRFGWRAAFHMRYRKATRAAILSERQGCNIHRAGFAQLD